MSQNDNTLETQKETEHQIKHTVVGVRFRPCGKIYTFEIDDIDVSPGMRVVVESEMGLSLAYVARAKYTIEKTADPLKKVRRIASEKDFETVQNNRSLEKEAKVFCIEKAKDYNLQMKVVTTETTLDKKRLIFYFTADGRIDFRELVKDLAAKFKTRIEMRQIGVRDEVKLIGGVGACGRETCCSLFLTSFEPITIRMAKEQELSINQSKLSGVCGRLMCCLSYEYKDTDEETPTQTIHDETPIAFADETKAEKLRPADSEKAKTEEQPKEAVCLSTVNIIPEEKKVIPSPQKEVVEDRKPMRRKRRKRRRSLPGRAFSERTSQRKPESIDTSQGRGPQHSERKEKGKPFSRRKKFWKKKKQ